MRDFRLEAFRIDEEFKSSVAAVSLPELVDAAKAFVANVERVCIMADLLPTSFYWATVLGQNRSVALHKIKGVYFSDGSDISPSESSAICGMAELYTRSIQDGLSGCKAKEESARQEGYNNINALIASGSASIPVAIEAILNSSVVAAWSAFEALSSDLWNAAYDCLPEKYRRRSGSWNRIWVAALKSREAEKIPPLSGCSNLGRDDMNHGFASLSSIRQSFSVLFSEEYCFPETAAIDSVLADNQLGLASVVRHVIVHKAGIADQTFVDNSEGMPGSLAWKPGDPINLDGRFAKTLADAVVKAGTQLTDAVEKWISAARRT